MVSLVRAVLTIALVTVCAWPMRVEGAASHGRDARTPSSPSSTVEKHVAVLLVNFTKQPSEPWTKDFLRDLYFGPNDSVAAYYAELSEDRWSVTGSVFGYLTIRASRAQCTYAEWGDAARAAAQRAGIELASYTNIVYVFPYQPTCPWNGSADRPADGQPGRNSWINGLLSLYVAVHELGHNFGIGHAGSLSCTADGRRVAFSTNCSTYTYGDQWDVMGYGGHRHMQAWHSWQLGFIGDNEVRTVTSDGTYRLAPSESPGNGPRILRLPGPGGDYYYLEIREPYGDYDDFAPDDPAVIGVTIRIVSEVADSTTKLIDTMPQSCTFNDAPLGLGRTFHDAVNKISITTVGLDQDGAQVEIHFGPAAGAGTDTAPAQTQSGVSANAANAAPPTRVADVKVQQVTGGLVAVSWQSASSEIGVDHYLVRAGGVLVGSTCALRLRNVPLEDGKTYQISVQAVDTTGNAGPVETISYAVPDFSSPTATGRLTAVRRGGSIDLSWSRASDNVAVTMYRLRRDGQIIGELGGNVTSFSDQAVGAASHKYSLVAFDATGNASRPIVKRVEHS